MAVSKRLRYEILRRDNHTCRYCGASAPDVKLTVDHVKPEALGGKTEPENLVTACEACNSGKSSVAPDATTVADVASDALRWSRAVAVAADQMLADHEAMEGRAVAFERRWNESGSMWSVLPDGWRHSVDRFVVSGLPFPVLLACAEKALANKKINHGDAFRYMCGIAWRKVTELHEAAQVAVGGTVPGNAKLSLVDYIYEQGTATETQRWEANAYDDSLGFDEQPEEGTASHRLLAAKAAIDEWTENLAAYSHHVDRLLGALPDAMVEQAYQWVDEMVEHHGVADQFTDEERVTSVLARLTDIFEAARQTVTAG